MNTPAKRNNAVGKQMINLLLKTSLVISLLILTHSLHAQYAIEFDGTNDYINIGTDVAFYGNSLTVEAWIYPTDLNSRRAIFSTRSSNTTGSWQMEVGTGSGHSNVLVVTGVNTWIAESEDNVLTLNAWNHVAFVLDGSSGTNVYTLYVNGELVGIQTQTDYTFINNTSNKTIGVGTNLGSFFSGKIDEVRLWSYARTQANIQDYMYRSVPGSNLNLVAYYSMNEGTGSTTEDISLNDNDGTFVNEPLWNVNIVNKVVCVDSSATGANNGSSWDDAYTTLQTALDNVLYGQQIWVAKGTYYPSSGYDQCDDSGDSTRFYHFRMMNRVSLYGGFSGTEDTESYDLNNRDFETNATILSGDIGTSGIKTDNCYHVFYHPTELALNNTAIIDGFTITQGYANGDNNLIYYGGGMLNYYCTININNCIFIDNYARFGGGGIYNINNSDLTITNSRFELNQSGSAGGAIYNTDSDINITNVDFISNNSEWNSSGGGGAIMNASSQSSISNAYFYNNTSTGTGGAINNRRCSPVINCCVFDSNSGSSGGAIYESEASSTVYNSLFKNNSASYDGGAIGDYNYYTPGIYPSTFINLTFSGNSADRYGGAVAIKDNSYATFNNCIIWGNTATNNGNEIYIMSTSSLTLNYSCYSDGTNDILNEGTLSNTTQNTTNYPRFVDIDNGDFRLFVNSPCKNKGSNTYNDKDEDVRGETRIQESFIDMGAYEWTSGVDSTQAFCFVDASQPDDSGDGLSWATAKKSLQAALDFSEVYGNYIWIAKGTYYPSSAYDLTDSTRYYHFRMIKGVEIYGGFEGTEDPKTFDIDDRDYDTNETILSGDIGTVGNNSDNCYHVFYQYTSLGITNSTILDGVTITGGNANGSSPHHIGGGISNYFNSPTIRNVRFISNSAKHAGGMFDASSASKLINCTFSSNAASQYGGGIFCQSANMSVKNSIFNNNSATYHGGAIYIIGASGSPSFTNSTYVYNSAGRGGAICDYSSSSVFNNCIFWDNSASSGDEFYIIEEGESTLNYCCYADNDGDINYEGDIFNDGGTFTATNNNITSDPMFINAPDSDFRIYGSSPCVNSGYNSYNTEDLDNRGQARIQNSTIDMGAFEWTEGADPYYPVATWTGATSTDWATATNWDIDAVPTNTNDVVIPDVANDPVIETSAESYNLTINIDAVVSVNAGGTLSVNNTLTNNADTPGLVLKSDATGTGKLVNNTSSVNATVQQYLTKDGWHYMGIPFAETPKASVFNRLWLIENDEEFASDGTDSGWSYLDTSHVIIPGKGYGVYTDIDTTFSMCGTLNTGNIETTTTFKNEGWNLIANPYPCTADWEVVYGNLTNVNDALYAWDPTLNSGEGNYATYIDGTGTNGQTQYLAPMQAFFVKSTASGSVSFTNDAKTTEASTFKNETLQNIIRLSVVDAEGRKDETVIRMKENATVKFDSHMDAFKIKTGSSLSPQLHSIFNGDEYSINTIPAIHEGLIIPIEVSVKEPGPYTLSVTELTGYNETYPLVLMNTSGDVLVENLKSSSYHCSESEGKTISLILGFSNSTVSSDECLKNNLYLWSENQNIVVSRMRNIPSQVVVLNTKGQVVYLKNVQTGELIIPVSTTGMYIVRVKPENGIVFNGKVVVK